MSDPVSTAADGALAELLEVSPQVDAAVILERDGGRIIASAPAANEQMAERFGTTCTKILEAAEQARNELGREPVSQIEVATPEGHVFVVSDATWVVSAVTDADPTVGLVFYDLKTALRTVREARGSGFGTTSSVAPGVTITQGRDMARDTPADVTDSIVTPLNDVSSTDGLGLASDDEQDDGSESQGVSRWRRRKP